MCRKCGDHNFDCIASLSASDDKKLYNDHLLTDISAGSIADFEGLKSIIGTSQGTLPPSNQLVINFQGFGEAEYEKAQQAAKKKQRELTEEDKERLQKLKQLQELREVRRSILRALSVRMPLLLFGVETLLPESEITLKEFVDRVDEASWQEYMPKGVTKEVFRKFIKYYDEDVFIGAGVNIRRKVLACDQMMPLERCETIAAIFAMFKNPDKETVLTPWKTVNAHMSDIFGGYDFREKDNFGVPVRRANDCLTHRAGDCVAVGNTVPGSVNAVKILEINSKTGLYPLWMAYNLYAPVSEKIITTDKQMEMRRHSKLWKDILAVNIFAVCKTPMAASITRRTLAGFTGAKTNVTQIDIVAHRLAQSEFAQHFNLPKDMQFDIIIGNPPYQQDTQGHGAQAKPIYQYFVRHAKKLNPRYISLIIPARWFVGGKGLDDFRREMLNDERIRILHDYPNSKDCFPMSKSKAESVTSFGIETTPENVQFSLTSTTECVKVCEHFVPPILMCLSVFLNRQAL